MARLTEAQRAQRMAMRNTQAIKALNEASAKTRGSDNESLSVPALDHGGLLGLSDDDHTQYHNTSRANTWLATKDSDDLAQGAMNLYFTSAEKTKLAGVASGATANSSDATLLDRANHAGTQATSTITGLDATLAAASSLIFTNSANIAANTAAIAGKADLVHAHAIADVTGLQAALDAKAPLPKRATFRVEAADFVDSNAARNLPFIGAAISSGTSGTSVQLDGGYGILRIASSATLNSGYRWLTASSTVFQTLGGMYFRGIIGWAAAVSSDVLLRMGYLDNNTATAPVDGIYLQGSGDQVSLVCMSNSVSTISDTAWEVPAQDTLYIAEIEVNTAITEVEMRIYDMTETLLFTETVDTNIPSGTSRLFGAGLIVTHSASAARNMVYVDRLEMGVVMEPTQ